jgi:hypothetical protein
MESAMARKNKASSFEELSPEEITEMANRMSATIVGIIEKLPIPPALQVGILGMAMAKLVMKTGAPLGEVADSMGEYFRQIEAGETPSFN